MDSRIFSTQAPKVGCAGLSIFLAPEVVRSNYSISVMCRPCWKYLIIHNWLMTEKNVPSNPNPRKVSLTKRKVVPSQGKDSRSVQESSVSVRTESDEAKHQEQLSRCRTFLRDGFERGLDFARAMAFTEESWRKESRAINDALGVEARNVGPLQTAVLKALEQDWARWRSSPDA